jgi:hypothetical protein
MLLVLAVVAAVSADEQAAYDAAKPAFEAHCFSCHADAKNDEAREHLDMTTYPFTGEHAEMAGDAVREVLGATGHAPTMPADDPGSVTGGDLDLLLAWADAWNDAHPMEGGEAKAQFPYAVPRETLIPGRPGMGGMVHIMVNAFGWLENLGLPPSSADDGKTHAELTDDWVMGYWRHPKGWVEALVMLNLEPFSVGKAGYPELGQSGEGLYDAQHSHLLFHQLMVAAHPIPAVSIFAGQGSATIGPPIFMHRASNPGPTVPRKHHKGENPHETLPVLGASYKLGGLWVEASAFSAKELTPDDSRFYPHPSAPVSFAARLRYDLWDLAELQVSGERLRDQGDMVPDAWQASASAYAYGDVREWRYDALLDWGLDHADGEKTSQGVLAELALRDPSYRDTAWLRGEANQREEADGSVSSPWLFTTLGFEHVLIVGHGLQLGAFAEATFAHVPLSSVYGTSEAVTLDAGLHLFGMWMLGGGGMHHEHGHGHHDHDDHDMDGMPGMPGM